MFGEALSWRSGAAVPDPLSPRIASQALDGYRYMLSHVSVADPSPERFVQYARAYLGGGSEAEPEPSPCAPPGCSVPVQVLVN